VPRDRTIVLAYNKPRGLVTTHKDEHGRETVYDRLVPRLPPVLRALRWHAVGRLDKDTTGLLLFTNDGAFVSHATQPSTALGKTYLVLAKGLLGEEDLEKLRRGVELTGGLGRSGPAKAELVGHGVATTWISLELHEGKNREVRRMLLAIGSQAIRLQRIQVGALALDVEEDCWRRLSAREVREKLGYPL
jgi:23S rRNA pseudouridine2605 synthase